MTKPELPARKPTKQRRDGANFKNRGRPPKNTVEKFWTRVEKTSGCWIWTGTVTTHGYGQLVSKKKFILSHRYSWVLKNGPIPEGLCVCHKCDTKLCVNPDHLFLGTLMDNNRDMVSKGRQVFGDRVGGSKLTNAQVLEISELLQNGIRARALAKLFNVSRQTISSIKCRRFWKRVLRSDERI